MQIDWLEFRKLVEERQDPNPMIQRYGKGPADKKCRECEHLICFCYPSGRRFYKCSLRSLSHSSSSDHRLKWNACAMFKERTGDIKRYFFV